MLKTLLRGLFVSMLFFGIFVSSSNTATSQSLTMAPFKIILNASGNSQDIQAIIGMAMPSGYHLDSYEVDLLFNNTKVSEAYSFRYCYIDQNFLASFDRNEIQADEYVQSLAGKTVTATVSGYYVAANSDGNYITKHFSVSSSVEIDKRGKKK